MNVTVLLPRSSVYPTIGFDLIDGFRACLKQKSDGASITIQTISIGFGGETQEIYVAAETAFLQHQADVLLLFGESHAAELVAPLADALGKWLIQVSPGANLCETVTNSQRFVHLSGNLAFHSWLTGQRAVTRAEQPGILATSYYDSGYGQIFAGLTSFQQQGGKMVGNFVTSFDPQQRGIEPLVAMVEDIGEATGSILAFFSGDVSPWFTEQLAAQSIFQTTQVFANAMLLDLESTQRMPENTVLPQMQGYTAWHPHIDDAEQQSIRALLQTITKREARLTTMLGWEAGLLVLDLVTNGLPTQTPARWLEGFDCETRKHLQLDPVSQQFYSDCWWVTRSEAGHWQSEPAAADPIDLATQWHSFSQLQPASQLGGWRNTYLCS